MGQQQLLLLVVGVIIVAVAVVVGINQFGDASASGIQDQIVQAEQHLGTLALAHYNKPDSYGGGGQTFVGWDVPLILNQVAGNSITWVSPNLTCTTAVAIIATIVTPGGTPELQTTITPL